MKKYFNFSLYKEALRQQRLVGWMSFLILALESIIMPMGWIMNGYYANKGGVHETAMEMHPLMLGLFAVAPLMTMAQFSFLNHRKACDFYHAIPHRRLTVFFSMMAAVLTWCAFLIVSGYGMGLICRLLLSGAVQFHIPWGAMLKYMLTLFAGCFCMAGLAGLAVSLTGTTFTNGLALLLIGLAPRVILNIVSAMMVNALPFIEYNAGSVLINWGYHIPFGWLAYLLEGRSALLVWMDWPAMGYTVGLGLLYMVLAAWAFHCRKSERAGRAAVSPLMQMVFRMVLPLGISLSVTTALIVEQRAGYGIGTDVLFVYLTLYIVAVVAYLLYELVTTKQWKAVGRSMPGLLVLLGINLVAVLGLNGWFNAQIGFLPEEGEIKKVEYIEQSSATSFLENHMSGMELDDRTLCDEIAAEITAQTQAWLKGREYYYDYTHGGTEELHYKAWCIFKVTDHKGRTWTRKIWMNNKQYERMLECVRQDEEIQKKLKDLSGALYTNFYADWADQSIDEENDADTLLAILQQEVEAVDFADWYRVLTGEYKYTGMNIRAHITFVDNGSGYGAGNRNLYINLPVELFPATYQAFMRMVTDGAELRQEELIKLLRNPEWELQYVNLDCYYHENGHIKDDSRYYYGEDHDMPALRQHLIDCLTPAVGAAPVDNTGILRIYVELFKKSEKQDVAAGVTKGIASRYKVAVDETYSDDNYIGESTMFFLTEEQMKTLRSKSFALGTLPG